MHKVDEKWLRLAAQLQAAVETHQAVKPEGDVYDRALWLTVGNALAEVEG